MEWHELSISGSWLWVALAAAWQGWRGECGTHARCGAKAWNGQVSSDMQATLWKRMTVPQALGHRVNGTLWHEQRSGWVQNHVEEDLDAKLVLMVPWASQSPRQWRARTQSGP